MGGEQTGEPAAAAPPHGGRARPRVPRRRRGRSMAAALPGRAAPARRLPGDGGAPPWRREGPRLRGQGRASSTARPRPQPITYRGRRASPGSGQATTAVTSLVRAMGAPGHRPSQLPHLACSMCTTRPAIASAPGVNPHPCGAGEVPHGAPEGPRWSNTASRGRWPLPPRALTSSWGVTCIPKPTQNKNDPNYHDGSNDPPRPQRSRLIQRGRCRPQRGGGFVH